MDPLSSLYKLARKNMVSNQLKVHNLTNTSLSEAFLSIAREKFVPPAFYNLCYYDHEVELNLGRVLFSPVTLVRLFREAKLIPGKKALIIGGGTGYSAAILSLCGVECYMVESEPSLYEQATSLLSPFQNIHCVLDNLTKGWAAHAPYDLILMDGGSIPFVPVTVLQQLNPVEGQLFAIINDHTSADISNIPLCQAVCIEPYPEDLSTFKTRILFECGVSSNLDLVPSDAFVF